MLRKCCGLPSLMTVVDILGQPTRGQGYCDIYLRAMKTSRYTYLIKKVNIKLVFNYGLKGPAMTR